MLASIHCLHPASLVPIAKSDLDRQGRRPIMIRASSEREDRVGETILKSAYAENRPMLDDFLRDGYYDYNHETDLIERDIRDLIVRKAQNSEILELQRRKHEAIIGGPIQVGLRDDFPNDLGLRDEGLYCKGYLLPTSYHGKKIIENLEAGFTAYGASISALAKPGDVRGNIIKSLTLRKIAIQPRLDSINPDTWVELAKAQDATLLNNIEKADYWSPATVAGPATGSEAAILDRLETILRRQRAQTALLLSIPKVADAIADEIASAIKQRSVSMSSSTIKDYLQGLYFFDDSQAATLADLLLVKLGAGK